MWHEVTLIGAAANVWDKAVTHVIPDPMIGTRLVVPVGGRSTRG